MYPYVPSALAASDLSAPPSKRFKPDEKEGQAAAQQIGKPEVWVPTKAKHSLPHRDKLCAPSRGSLDFRADDGERYLHEDESLGEKFLAKRGVSRLSTGRRVDATDHQLLGKSVANNGMLRCPNKVRHFRRARLSFRV